MRRQDLDCDCAFKPHIPCAIHLPHPARAQRRTDFIRAKLCTSRERHNCRRL
jgi:hypothetical protein